MAEPNDDDGVIAAMPDLQIEVAHTEDMLILQQTDYSGHTDRMSIHRWQVRFLAEEMGLLPARSEGEASATRRLSFLARRMRVLHARIEQLDEWLAKQPDYDNADINVEVGYSGATYDLSQEFIDELKEWEAAAPASGGDVTRGTAPKSSTVGRAERAPKPSSKEEALPMPRRYRLGVAVQPGEDVETVAIEAFRLFAEQNAMLLRHVFAWGDGDGGALLDILRAAVTGSEPDRGAKSTGSPAAFGKQGTLV
ncbi:MAG: hypothetical protein DI563_02520 [Variovorax paradoxus]|uniref:Uncharacterized protein n=1 Tax=Variovorax paradoxus TaxID=34073 RepID=A0A2W5QS36_VARPD|nr:MAG: hypothetical protein DI563_02520 [Variovorax paradoxus]